MTHQTLEPRELDSRVVRSTIWTAVDFGTTFVAGLILAAVFLATLGPTAYGVFLLLLLFGTPGLLSIADLGMGGVLITYTARFAASSPALVPKLWSFCVAYYALAAVVVVGVTSTGIVVLREPVQVALSSAGASPEILVALLVLQPLSLIGLMLEYMLAGMLDFRPIQLSSIAMQIIRVIGATVILTGAGDVTALLWWVVACSTGRVVTLGAVTVARYRSSLRRPSLRQPEARGWLTYSSSLLARNVAGLVFNFSDRLIIPWFLPIARLADYDVAAKAPNMVRALVSISTSAMVPAGATNRALDRMSDLRRHYLHGGRIAAFIFVPPLMFLLVTVALFIELWVGLEFVHVSLPAQVFLASYALAIFPAIGDAIMLGMGEARRTVKATWTASLVNVVVSVALVQPLGILGVVIGTLAGAIISDVWLSILHWRAFNIAGSAALLQIVLPLTLLSAVSVLMTTLVLPWFVPVNLLEYGLVGAVVVSLAYGVGYVLVLDRNERDNVMFWIRRLVAPGSSWADDVPDASGRAVGREEPEVRP